MKNKVNTAPLIMFVLSAVAAIFLGILEFYGEFWRKVSYRDSLISWGKGSSLALVGNPPRDGGSIKILVWTHQTSVIMSELCQVMR